MSAEIHSLPTFRCATCGVMVHLFPVEANTWQRLREEYRRSLGINVQAPTCLGCLSELVAEQAQGTASPRNKR